MPHSGLCSTVALLKTRKNCRSFARGDDPHETQHDTMRNHLLDRGRIVQFTRSRWPVAHLAQHQWCAPINIDTSDCESYIPAARPGNPEAEAGSGSNYRYGRLTPSAVRCVPYTEGINNLHHDGLAMVGKDARNRWILHCSVSTLRCYRFISLLEARNQAPT